MARNNKKIGQFRSPDLEDEPDELTQKKNHYKNTNKGLAAILIVLVIICLFIFSLIAILLLKMGNKPNDTIIVENSTNHNIQPQPQPQPEQINRPKKNVVDKNSTPQTQEPQKPKAIVNKQQNANTSTTFPDPSKSYYIDCPETGGRLSANAGSVNLYGQNYSILKLVNQSESSDNTRWKFVSAANNRWFIQLAKGGGDCRLWAVKLPQIGGLAMTDTSKGGGWTQFTLTDAGNGKYFISAPDGPPSFIHLRFDKNAKPAMAGQNNGPNFQFSISEVK